MAISRNGTRINFREPAQRRRGWGSRLFHLALGVVAAWIFGLLAFVAVIPTPAPRADADTPTDAIIVLTGGGDRVAEGFRLLDRGLAKRLLISGVAPGVTIEQLIDRMGLPRSEVPSASAIACCVTLGYEAESTAGNASESDAWLRSNDAHSVRLVTANYHMLRSLLEFRRTLPGVAVVPNPVFPAEVRDRYWFVKPRTLLLLVNEYHKYIVALGRALPGDLERWTPDWAAFGWQALWSRWFGRDPGAG